MQCNDITELTGCEYFLRLPPHLGTEVAGGNVQRYEQLRRLASDYISCDCSMAVVYSKAVKSTPKDSYEGRLYAKGHSLQSASRLFRTLVTLNSHVTDRPRIFDVDFKNCFPSILEQLCHIHGIDCHELTMYNKHRDSWITDGILNKKAVLMAMFHGSYSICEGDSLVFQELVRCFRRLQHEVPLMYPKVKASKRCIHMFGSQLSRILCDYETRSLAVVCATLTKAGWTVVSPQFDGCLVMSPDGHFQAPSQILLDECSAKVRAGVGIDLTLVNKPLDSIPPHFPPFDDINPPAMVDDDNDGLPQGGFTTGREPVIYPPSVQLVTTLLTPESPYISDIDFEGNKVYCILAMMGSGKTHATHKYVRQICAAVEAHRVMTERYAKADRKVRARQLLFKKWQERREKGFFEERPDLPSVFRARFQAEYAMNNAIDRHLVPLRRILIITCRITFSVTMKGLYPSFEHYHETSSAPWGADHAIRQYESLHRLYDNRNPLRLYDLIILDEFRSILDCMCCAKTNKQNFRRNADMLKLLLQGARQVLISDADLNYDSVCSTALEGMLPSGVNKTVVHEYTVNTPHHRLSIAENGDSFLAAMKGLLETGGKVALNCRARADAEAYAQIFEDAGHAVYSVTGKSSKKTVDSFHLIDDIVGDYDVVIFTSRVTVGADILARGWTVYICGARGGASNRQLLQMAGRWRHAEFDMFMFTPTIQLESRSTTECLEAASTAMNDRSQMWREWWQSIGGTLHKGQIDHETRTVFLAPTWLFYVVRDLLASDMKEFVWGMATHAVSKGWIVQFPRDGTEISEEVAGIKATNKDEAEQAFEELVAEIHGVMHDTDRLNNIVAEQIQRARQNDAPVDGAERAKIAKTALHFTGQEISAQELSLAVENAGKIYHLAAEVLGDDTSRVIRSIDYNYNVGTHLDRNVPYCNITSENFSVMRQSVHAVVTRLGFRSMTDSDTRVDKKTTRALFNDPEFAQTVAWYTKAKRLLAQKAPDSRNDHQSRDPTTHTSAFKVSAMMSDYCGTKLVIDRETVARHSYRLNVRHDLVSLSSKATYPSLSLDAI